MKHGLNEAEGICSDIFHPPSTLHLTRSRLRFHELGERRARPEHWMLRVRKHHFPGHFCSLQPFVTGTFSKSRGFSATLFCGAAEPLLGVLWSFRDPGTTYTLGAFFWLRLGMQVTLGISPADGLPAAGTGSFSHSHQLLTHLQPPNGLQVSRARSASSSGLLEPSRREGGTPVLFYTSLKKTTIKSNNTTDIISGRDAAGRLCGAAAPCRGEGGWPWALISGKKWDSTALLGHL